MVLAYIIGNQIVMQKQILYNQDGLIPVEVEASDNITSKSLNSYVKKYNPKYSIRISNKNFGFENNIKSVSLYAVFLIK